MQRQSGYLANLLNVPPLIFRFQFNPELLSEKKSFKYNETNSFGPWGFDRARAESGLEVLEDFKEWGSLLAGTKALEADTGGQRSFALDFVLDASTLGAEAPAGEEETAEERERREARESLLIVGDKRVGGRIEPDLAVLRSFVNPSLGDPIDLLVAWLRSGIDSPCYFRRPPVCDLKLGGIELACVMTDLNIKVTKFNADLTPLRAEVSVTLKEQTFSLATVLDFVARNVEVGKSYGNLTGDDWVQAVPGAGLVQNVFEL